MIGAFSVFWGKRDTSKRKYSIINGYNYLKRTRILRNFFRVYSVLAIAVNVYVFVFPLKTNGHFRLIKSQISAIKEGKIDV